MDKGIIAIYHRVYKREKFEKAAKDIYSLVKSSQMENPNHPRRLYVDIMEHRNPDGSFDDDMFKLHQFVIEHLGDYLEEINMPLIHAKNEKGQRNDIPEKIIIEENIIEEDNMMIENYNNTEFVYEEDVNEYLKKVSSFLKKYNELDFYYSTEFNVSYDSSNWLIRWRKHMKELIIELVNAFVSGNFYTVSAMTRTLIECYVYIKIIVQEEKKELIDEWCICESMKIIKKNNNNKDLKKYLEDYLKTLNINFEEKWNFYTKKSENENSWLRSIIDKKGKITFYDICKYLNEPYLYEDFSDACDFVHSLSLNSKLFPFTFYSSIYTKMFVMLNYVFKSIRLFPITNDLNDEIDNLLIELTNLSEKYLK